MNPPRKLRTEQHEQQQANHLRTQTRNHDVYTRLFVIFVLCIRGHAAANGLKQEREEIAAHEEDGVGARLETGEVLAVDHDYAGQAEIGSGTYKSGAYCEADEIPMMEGIS